MLEPMLKKVREKPLHAAGAGLVGVIAVALVLGLLSGDPPPASPSQAAAAKPAPMPVPTSSAPLEPTPPDVAPPAGGSVRPAALALGAQASPGAREAIANGGGEGATWAPLATLEIRDGAPLATLDTAATREREARGWSPDAWMRVTRSGLVRVETAGPHTFVLASSEKGEWRTGRAMRCRLAVGDPAGVVVDGGRRPGQAVAQVALAAGFHWLYQTCEVRHNDAAAEVSMTGPGMTAPQMVALHLPGDAAPAPAPEVAGTEANP